MKIKEISREIYRQRQNFIILGLTGRTGSGCSTAANILSQEKESILYLRQNSHDDPVESRRRVILTKHFDHTWKPFTVIKVRDVISTFILECSFDEINSYLRSLSERLDFTKEKDYFLEVKQISECMNPVYSHHHENAKAEDVYCFISKTLPRFTEKFKEHVETAVKEDVIGVFQKIGNNIRKHGDAVEKSEILLDHVYSLSDRINQIIKTIRHYNEERLLPDYFVVDSFRNPIEIKFFQERYSAFYLIAITCDENNRKERLIGDKVPYDQIDSIDSVEYSRKNILKDHVSFISQDISGCIEFADIYICNDGSMQERDLKPLAYQLLKYVSLIKHPGIVTPSNDERLMQIAFDAKLNSGCLSRQVGASISDDSGKLLSIGWNDSPGDQTPCLLRSANELLGEQNSKIFSHYEQSTPEFKEKLRAYTEQRQSAADYGLNLSYCFKAIKNSLDQEKNQVHTRSIHAEESAFLSLVGSSGNAKGGTLYTTASPCVLCAKKAYHLGIARVVYIDPYPDISFEHIFRFGERVLIHDLFSGAVGSAYHRLYLPIVSYKDELGSYVD